MLVAYIFAYLLVVPIFWNLAHVNRAINEYFIFFSPTNQTFFIFLVIGMMKTYKYFMHNLY